MSDIARDADGGSGDIVRLIMAATLALPHGRQAASLPDRAGPDCVVMQIHGSCASRTGDGVLLIGPPGAGKSDLLLRLLARGFDLVADDRVDIDGRHSPAAARRWPACWKCAASASCACRMSARRGSRWWWTWAAGPRDCRRQHVIIRSICRWFWSIPTAHPHRNAWPSRSTVRSDASHKSPEPSPHEQPTVSGWCWSPASRAAASHRCCGSWKTSATRRSTTRRCPCSRTW